MSFVGGIYFQTCMLNFYVAYITFTVAVRSFFLNAQNKTKAMLLPIASLPAPTLSL